MRKIETTAEKKKQERRRQIIVGIILVVIMVLSTAGYSINRRAEEEAKETYNNFEFVKTATGWQIQKQNFGLVTRHLPNEVENISSTSLLSYQNFAGREVYFVAFSDEAKMAANEIARNIPALRIQLACLEQDANLTECADLPLKTCDSFVIAIQEKRFNNTSANVSVVSVEPKIYQKDSCIFIESPTNLLFKAADRLLFGIYRVI